MEEPARLVFRRSATYLDRGVRYLIEVDGRSLAPRLQGPDSVQVDVSPGEHSVRVSARRTRFFEVSVSVEPGQTREFSVAPGRRWWAFNRQPRLKDERGLNVPGNEGRRESPIADPKPHHSS